ncbi:MAG TPA: hypothetical protein VFB80_14210 [Pirellulaceae bacterium]|nr:hypothetical protein [Pirellulaceae bacterium]
MNVLHACEAARILPPVSDNCLRPPALLSAEAEDGESVEWIWTHFAGGHSAVTGYRIVPRWPALLCGGSQ